MAKRGRPKKKAIDPLSLDHAKLLKQFEQEQKVQLETLYKELAIIKRKVDYTLTQLGFMNDCENLSQAVFKAGRAYGPLDEANDKLDEILENMYAESDYEHYNDIFDNN